MWDILGALGSWGTFGIIGEMWRRFGLYRLIIGDHPVVVAENVETSKALTNYDKLLKVRRSLSRSRSRSRHKQKVIIKQLNLPSKLTGSEQSSLQKISNLLDTWSDKIKMHKNETLVRLDYYKFLIECVFSERQSLETFFSYIHNGHIFAHTTSSDSVCFTAVIQSDVNNDVDRPKRYMYFLKNGVKVFVKLTRSYDSAHKFKEIEPRIYKQIINNIVNHQLSPHVMLFMAHEHIKNWKTFVHSVLDKTNDVKFRLELFKSIATQFKVNQRKTRPGGEMLITECGEGISLSTFMKSYSSSKQSELVSILFQLLYTLLVLDKIKLTHYDLHFGNIFLEEVEDSVDKTFVYFISLDTYVVLTVGKYFVKLFDWDFAYNKQLITHAESKSRNVWPCDSFGKCNTHSSTYDVHQILAILKVFSHKLGTNLNSFIDQQFGNTSSTDPNVNLTLRPEVCGEDDNSCDFETLCELKQNKDDGLHCTGQWKPRPKSINGIETMLKEFVDAFATSGNSNSNGRFLRWSYPGFKVYKLPQFNSEYKPGSYLWNGHVFASSERLLKHVRREIMSLDEDGKLNDNEWK